MSTSSTVNPFVAVVDEDSLESLAMRYSAANQKNRALISDGLASRAMAALDEGDMEAAQKWAQLRKEVVTASEGIAADYEMAQRMASFRSVVAEMELNLTDRARELVDSGTVGACERLVARIGGLNVTRTAVSDDGANRAGSDEPKGSVKEALIAFVATLPVGTWATIAQAGKWITAQGQTFGYTSAYVCDGGRIMARNADTEAGRAWRAENGIEFAKVEGMGSHGPAPVWCVRRSA